MVIEQRPCRSGCGSSLKLTSTLVSRRGWHIGIRSGVRLAPITPATCATARTSPFAIFPRWTFSRVSGIINTRACAVATRSVESFFVTSTILARPDSLECVKLAIFLGESPCFAGSTGDYRSRSEQESSEKAERRRADKSRLDRPQQDQREWPHG